VHGLAITPLGHVLDAADVLGAEINSSSEANCLLLAKQKTSEVPMCGFLDRICSSQRPPSWLR